MGHYSGRRLAAVTAAAVAVVVAWAGSAHGGSSATEIVYNELVDEYYVNGVPGAASALTIHREGSAFVFRDENGIFTLGGGCEASPDGNQLTCDSSRYTRLQIKLEDGADTLGLDVPRRHLLSISLGSGNDVFRGGPAAEAVGGDAGADVLKGRGGRDALDGGRGRDVLVGGADRDALLAKDGRRDAKIDCGRDGGKAQVDRKDPRARNCRVV